MAQAILDGTLLAESTDYEMVEGNVYFPPKSINQTYFRESEKKTICPWKGEASYYDIIIDEDVYENAAWYYPDPKEKAKHIKGHVAFGNEVSVEK